jgi:pyruvate/2-oxoacid:ferredoxin oxidoreductase beta subunit
MGELPELVRDCFRIHGGCVEETDLTGIAEFAQWIESLIGEAQATCCGAELATASLRSKIGPT